MIKTRLRLIENGWSARYWLLCKVGVIIGLLFCILMFVFLYLEYRRGKIEQEIVESLLSKSPLGSADVDSQDSLCYRFYSILGISRPVNYIFLKGNQIHDNNLKELVSLPHLTLISIDQCPITDQGVKEIAKVQTLESLNLFFCDNITDVSLEYLGTAKSLEDLDISTNSKQLTGRSIHCLSELPNLEKLSLYSCVGVSDDAVESLSLLKHLVNLDIRGTLISKEGAKRLCSELPKTLILTDY